VRELLQLTRCGLHLEHVITINTQPRQQGRDKRRVVGRQHADCVTGCEAHAAVCELQLDMDDGAVRPVSREQPVGRRRQQQHMFVGPAPS
jgi:hypothetical protein